MTDWLARFQTYFERPVAERAAKSLSHDAEIEFRIDDETFTFHKSTGTNAVRSGPARDPQVIFTLTPKAAEAVLDDPAESIGTIGVGIMKLVASSDADKKIRLKLNAGFLSLFNKGYLGVLTAGGAEIASFLASKGVAGLGGIKEVLKKLRA